jgi:LacI family transcriptional regulator, gluconate utilization system Gnt-I transcriptional repressor
MPTNKRSTAAPIHASAPTLHKRSRGPAKGVRITDVATLAGVSPITVSRVFNNPESVAPETLARVRDAVHKLGYVPNRLAGSLSSAKSRLIAAVVPTIAHSLFSESVQVFSDAMSRAGYQVLLGLSGYGADSDDPLLDAVLSRRPEGMLLIGIARASSLRQRLLSAGIPIVESWEMTDAPLDMLVGFSHYQVGVAVADRLLSRQATRLVLITANDDRAMARRAGFLDTLAQHGMRDIPEVVVAPPSSAAQGKAGLEQILARAPDVDAIFCGSDRLALGAIAHARAAGIAVPGRLAVCGFGDLDFAADMNPPLTTVHVDGRRIGMLAAERLIARLRGGASGPVTEDVGFELVERGTT